jgi:Peptidase family M28
MIGPRYAVYAGLVVLGQSLAQFDSVAVRYASTITPEDLRKHLEVLASDAYEGRETGEKGQRMAAEYLEAQFTKMGLGTVPPDQQRHALNGMRQEFPLLVEEPGGLEVWLHGTRRMFMDQVLYFRNPTASEILVDSVVLAGTPQNGTTNINIGGHAALVVRKPSMDAEEGGLFAELRALSTWAQKAGAKVVLFACSDIDGIKDQYGHYLVTSRMRLAEEVEEGPAEREIPVLIISYGLAQEILNKDIGLSAKVRRKALLKPTTFIGTRCAAPVRLVPRPRTRSLTSENILAFVPGRDRAAEVLVLTAHYDHIGMDDQEVYNGADDDGSGTVALLEIAEAFAKARAEGKGPLRSILVMPVSGEEKGLLGSEYYAQHPVVPLESTVADLNIDMIGRRDELHKDTPPYVYVIGSDRLSSDLHRINQEMNDRFVHLDLDYRFNAPDDPNRFYYRSDHYNFAKRGVPSIFFFSGVHEDYHGPGDEVHKIDFTLLCQRARLVFHTAWELAYRPERIVRDKPIPTEQ